MKFAVCAAILLVLGSLAAPVFKQARQRETAKAAVANLRKITAAKDKYAKKNHLDFGNSVDDAKALVPEYLPYWPSEPPTHALYAANSIGVDPTVNGLTESQIENQCTTDQTNCTF